MKYVIGQHSVTGYYHVSVFSEDVVHSLVAKAMTKSVIGLTIVSAGFVHIDKGQWFVSNRGSTSLGIGPREGDTAILEAFLVLGLTGLELANVLALGVLGKR